jgi:hypothetical protein
MELWILSHPNPTDFAYSLENYLEIEKSFLGFCELFSFEFEKPHRLIKMKHVSKSKNKFFPKINL